MPTDTFIYKENINPLWFNGGRVIINVWIKKTTTINQPNANHIGNLFFGGVGAYPIFQWPYPTLYYWWPVDEWLLIRFFKPILHVQNRTTWKHLFEKKNASFGPLDGAIYSIRVICLSTCVSSFLLVVCKGYIRMLLMHGIRLVYTLSCEMRTCRFLIDNATPIRTIKG